MASEPKDWKEEAYAAYLANEARQDTLHRQRLAERGEVSIELVAAEDDAPPASEEFQAGLSGFGAALKDNGVTFGQMAIAMDSVDAHGYPLGEFIAALKTLGGPAIGAVAVAAGAWVQAHYGRKVRLKIGELEAEGRSVEEVEKLLKVAADYQKPPETPAP